MNKKVLIYIASGLLFGAGLAISGMADPQRVRGFLDLFGHWDPTLMFVMGGAVAVMTAAWILQKRLATPFVAEKFSLPTRQDIDRPLILGGVLFGIGWGIAGLCPGPAVIGLVIAPAKAAIFVTAMVIGMALHRFALDR